MVRISSREFPEKNELVIGTVEKIAKHGVYISLKEYNSIQGYCHISEIAGAWIRNIRNFVRIDQQVVAKILRVQEKTGQIDLSLKRVSDQHKKDKVQEYKRQNSALAMVTLLAEKSGESEEEVRKIIEDPIVQAFGSLYIGFEELVLDGIEALQDLGIPDDMLELMKEVADTSISINRHHITADMGIRSFAPDGISQIKKLLYAAERVLRKYPEVTSEVTTIGAPQYRIHMEGRTIEEVSEVYDDMAATLVKTSEKLDLEYKIERKDNR